jgi:putative aldouronate transport system permease protein
MKARTTPPANVSTLSRKDVKRNLRRHRLIVAARNWELYVMLLPILIYFFIFEIAPLPGLQIAFKDFKISKGIWGSEWASSYGFKYFIRFVKSPMFKQLMTNTLRISLYSLVAGFAPPIILALLLNYQKHDKFKKLVQSLSFAPHFISMVVFVGMLRLFFQDLGIVNRLLELIGLKHVNFLGDPDIFPHLYVWSGIWKGVGWSSIIYVGALSNVSPELHEAAIADGANLWKRIWHIDIPGIMDTILTLLILDCGSILSVGFEKVYLMLNDLNSSKAEVISTYVYKQGLQGGQFSYSTAIGLFNSVVNFIMVILVNTITKKMRDISIL